MNVKINLTNLLLLILTENFWIVESEKCSVENKFNSKHMSRYIENTHVLSNLANVPTKQLSLLTGIPYFLLNNNYPNKTFYGQLDRPLRNLGLNGKFNHNLWMSNKDVNNMHMQWDIVKTNTASFYQIRRALDGLVLTCIRNDSWVGLGNSTETRELSFWTIEESKSKIGYFTIQCKRTPDRLLSHDQTNELLTKYNVNGDKFLWQFLPAYKLEDYYMKFEIVKFNYDISLEDLLESDRQTVTIAELIMIPNKSPATLQHQITQSKTMEEKVTTTVSQSFSQGLSSSLHTSSSIQHSKSTKYGIITARTNSVNRNQESQVDVEVSAGAFGYGAKIGTSIRDSHSYTEDFAKTNSKDGETGVTDDKTMSSESGNTVENTTVTGTQYDHTKSVTYSIQQTVEVPPNTSVKIGSYIDWINDLTVPYTATAYVTLEAVRTLKSFSGCLRNHEGARRCRHNARMAKMDADAVEWFLRQYNSDLAALIIGKCGQVVMLKVDGAVTGSYGLKSVLVAEEVPIDMLLVNRINNN